MTMTEPAPCAIDDLVAFSAERIAVGSKSFAVAARLFSPETRASAFMLYAWCRHCDDVVDGQTLGFNEASAASPEDGDLATRVAELEAKTRAACRGRPPAGDPYFAALAEVVRRHDIPERHSVELIEGFRMDAAERHYETIGDTLEYCYHVAGVVGVMMSMLMGARSRDTLNRASDLGIAFQLTNIARDVVPDARTGRVYLPAEWLRDAGMEPTSGAVADPANRQRVFDVTNRLLETAEPYYTSAQQGLSDLPLRSAWAVAAARSVYRAIGLEVKRLGANAWDGRAGTTSAGKLLGVAGGLTAAVASRRRNAVPRRDDLWTKPDLGT